ncbi:MAG: hypothetical protein NTZ53_14260 [Cyanobacteria bacterium]|nr:hypothetical protein [Cyanobacteriota bacterium]
MNHHERGSLSPSSLDPQIQTSTSSSSPKSSQPSSSRSSPNSNPDHKPGFLAPLHHPSFGSDLARYTAIQAAFSRDLAQWQSHWSAITAESLTALAGLGIAISYRQSISGGFIATLLHQGGGGIDSGLCPTLAEARSFVLGQGLADLP